MVSSEKGRKGTTYFGVIKNSWSASSLSIRLNLRNLSYKVPIFYSRSSASLFYLHYTWVSLSASFTSNSVADSRSLSWTRFAILSRLRSLSLSSSKLDLAFCRCLKNRLPSKFAWKDFCFPVAFPWILESLSLLLLLAYCGGTSDDFGSKSTLVSLSLPLALVSLFPFSSCLY